MQLVEQESLPGFVRLKPLSVNHQLRNGPLAHTPHHLIRGGLIRVHVDLCIDNPMGFEELLRCPAIAAPGGGIDLNLHPSILLRLAGSMRIVTADEIKTLLHLAPHPIEGGYFRRTYTSAASLELGRGNRRAATAIYYLLEPGTFSEMHVLDSDEIFHFYLGDPVEMLQLHPDGSTAVFTLGPDLQSGQYVQMVVPAGIWQGTRLVGDGKVALLG